MSLPGECNENPGRQRCDPQRLPAPRPRETPRGGAGGPGSAAGGARRSCLPRRGAPGLASALQLLPSGHLPGESAERRPAGDGDWEPPGERRRGGGGGESAGAEAGRGRRRQEPPVHSSRPRVQEALKPRPRCEPLGLGRRRGGGRGALPPPGGVAGLGPFVLARSPWPPTPLLSCGGGSSRRGSRARRRGREGAGGARPPPGVGGDGEAPGGLRVHGSRGQEHPARLVSHHLRRRVALYLRLLLAQSRAAGSASHGSQLHGAVGAADRRGVRVHLHLWRRLQGHLAVPLRPGLREQLRVQLQGAAAQRRAPAPDQPQGKDAPGGLPRSYGDAGVWGRISVKPCAGWPGVCRRYQEATRRRGLCLNRE